MAGKSGADKIRSKPASRRKENESHTVDICIIGGGAAGMSAAVSAGQAAIAAGRDRKIVILEKMDRLGRKIRATGNGRCNLTNEKAPGCEETLSFFRGIGLMTRTEDEGRIYPYSGDAADVTGILEEAIHRLGIRQETGVSCQSVMSEEKGFRVECRRKGADEIWFADKVLIAAGGKAAPKLGTTGDGARIARTLGHRVTRLAPALTAIETVEDTRDLSGLRVKARLSLKYAGDAAGDPRILFSEEGEIQFTDYGVSGICAMNMSRFIVLPEGKSLEKGFDDYLIVIDFLPDISDAGALIDARISLLGADDPRLLRSMLRSPLDEKIYREAMHAAGGSLSSEKGAGRQILMDLLKKYPLHVRGLRGWQYAQVTRGGVDRREIDQERMESKLLPGLFFAGEVLDYDGPCGGYNLQYAWQTGIRAGRNMI